MQNISLVVTRIFRVHFAHSGHRDILPLFVSHCCGCLKRQFVASAKHITASGLSIQGRHCESCTLRSFVGSCSCRPRAREMKFKFNYVTTQNQAPKQKKPASSCDIPSWYHTPKKKHLSLHPSTPNTTSTYAGTVVCIEACDFSVRSQL